MIPKKNPKANLEKKRHAFFQIGLILSGGLCLAAFEYVAADDFSSLKINKLEAAVNVLKPEINEEIPEIPKVPIKQNRLVNLDQIDSIVYNSNASAQTQFSNLGNNDQIVMNDDLGFFQVGYGKPIPEDTIYEFVQFEPQFKGGEAALAEYIQNNIDLNEISFLGSPGGTVYVQFVINTDGSIQDAEIHRGVDPGLDRAALKTVENMPNWIPGENAGKPVRVRYILPINLILN
jgi:protein TonB